METMNNNSQENMQELESLRQQVSEFKQRMDQQQIVNDRLIRRSMTARVSWFKQTNGWVSALGMLLLPVIVLLFRYAVGMQWAPIVVLAVLMIAEAVFNFWQIHTISASQLAKDNLLSVRRRLLDFKRREKWQMLIEVPMIVLWAVWAFWTALDGVTSDAALGYAITGAVGVFFGLMIGFVFFFLEMRTLGRAVRELEEFIEE